MFGAICGDIIGSRFERKNIKTEDFELFTRDCNFTDDTVMTLAVCYAILYNDNPVSFFDYRKRAEEYAIRYKAYYSRYSDAGFGQMFSDWAKSERLYRQRSYGNGGAMRVSSIGWAYGTFEEVLKQAELSCSFTHADRKAAAGAKAVAGAVFLAKNHYSKKEIKLKAEKITGWNFDFTLDEIRPEYSFFSETELSVPQAVVAFLEAENYEDTIRKAISIGGDSDTIACMAGGIAEAFYGGVPEYIADKAKFFLDAEMKRTISRFQKKYCEGVYYENTNGRSSE